ncbi:hypothetical protein AGOR_G00133460 [Albula goreensis]|uniref:Eukaryotic translation initiation factor 2D n=1 Tax=Albula goreensis TaxID=1534307 RepID=A0A8T3DA31_9TELE|nr:hypothetical protein AGOR_G00133460 [Albula goreensis]
MFAKQFRVKSNTVIKGSDRRKLKTDISNAFPMLSAEDLTELVPNKEELNVVKIYAHKGDSVTLYVLHKNPIFFELEKQLYPTVYTLWRCPDLLPTFTTWPAVLQKLAGGADLMLPGVVVPLGGLPEVKKGECCSISVVRNRAPVAVGTATMTTAEMLGLGMKGRGVSVLHTYTDYLWAFGDKSGPPSIPSLDSEVATEGDVEAEGEEGVGEHGDGTRPQNPPAPVWRSSAWSQGRQEKRREKRRKRRRMETMQMEKRRTADPLKSRWMPSCSSVSSMP